jgi:uncharacterized protein (TIGR00299 family) protein
MNYIYFDLIGGISGDMAVAAMLDLGVSLEVLKKELFKINLKGYVLSKNYVQRGHARALKWNVRVEKERNYSFNEIVRLVRSSRLSQAVQQNILKIYGVLKNAETKVHGHKHQDIRFHQLGEIDSLVDIVSLSILLDKLDVAQIFYGDVPLGSKVAPATMELLKNSKVYFTSANHENLTPTGLAFLGACGRQIQPEFKETFRVGRVGCGAGAFEVPDGSNIVRAVELKSSLSNLKTDVIYCLEANIDDMNPQVFEYVFDRLFQAGALDVFVQNITMKKTRPGFLLNVLSSEENLGKISEIIFKETTTLGVRFSKVERLKLERNSKILNFKGMRVRVKCVRKISGGWRMSPEYDDCRKIAVLTKTPLMKIIKEVQQKAEIKWRSQD